MHNSPSIHLILSNSSVYLKRVLTPTKKSIHLMMLCLNELLSDSTCEEMRKKEESNREREEERGRERGRETWDEF